MSHSGNITADHITIVSSDGESGTVNTDHPKYAEALAAVREGNFNDFMLIANPIIAIKKYANDRIVIDAGVVLLDGNELHHHMADRMIGMIDEGHGVEPLANFIVNLFDNPSKRAVDELYGFLEISDLQITDDGHFVAYKKINEDWTDVYTGKIDNSIGAVVSMPRNMVDEDQDRTCSTGLHFCGRAYLTMYPGERTVVVKINPRDVVAIPSDYDNHKGRTCRYEVIEELVNGDEQSLEGSHFDADDLKRPTSLDVDSDDIVFYQSREAAREDARNIEYLTFKDLGADQPKGYRWATIGS